MPGVIGAFIPIVFFLTAGLVWITAIYLRSREKQMLIEKGLTTDDIKMFFDNKRKVNPFLLAKIGVISIFFGIGVGLGMFLDDITSKEYWTVLTIFVSTGLGFIIANFFGRKLEKEA
ncbi:MAG: DUF6249 domain-containing protein [Bacillota bacterium]